jgi:hypothetical protein
MSETLSLADDADFAMVSSVAATLEPVKPSERRAVMRDEAAFLLDGLLVRVARGRGPLDLALGDGLASLAVGDRLLRLGFSGLGDYARERLGISGSTAEKLARLSRHLAERPLLRAAVLSGAVSARKAETVAGVARGAEEAAWVERARVETVRALAAGVKEVLGEDGEEEERWERVGFAVRPEAREKLDEALALAGKLLGAATPKWQRVEALCQEYLGAHPAPALDEVGDGWMLDHAPAGRALDELKAWLEQEYRQWAFLTCFDPAPRPAGGAASGLVEAGPAACGPVAVGPEAGGPVACGLAAGDAAAVVSAPDLARLDADLRRLRDLRSRWDDLLGHLAMLLRQVGLWRDMQFVSFGHYCTERLGMSERAVSQRVALERRFYELPGLREALRDGRVSYEKARIVAAHADERTLDAWIERAGRLTCIALSREAEAEEEAQVCARGECSFRLPARVLPLLDEAIRAAKAAAGRFITPGEALERIAEHAIATWKPQLDVRNTLQKRVLDRDRGWCQVPGCSRAALHVHHVRFRSHGGTDTAANLVSLCAAHHLPGVHAGHLRVAGAAPHRLRWSFAAGGGPASGAAGEQSAAG